MKSERTIIIYSFLACVFLMLIGIFSAISTAQLLASFIYLPLVFFFGTKIFYYFLDNASSSRAVSPAVASPDNPVPLPTTQEMPVGIEDKNKRLFLQLIGSTGISLLIMALFSRKARDSFFGGAAQVPEIVGVKDIAGNQINPAEKTPTDDYKISEVDDKGSPTYFGFMKKNGAWYIMQYSSGNFRYIKGENNFSSNWDVRDKLTYDYFDAVFS